MSKYFASFVAAKFHSNCCNKKFRIRTCYCTSSKKKEGSTNHPFFKMKFIALPNFPKIFFGHAFSISSLHIFFLKSIESFFCQICSVLIWYNVSFVAQIKLIKMYYSTIKMIIYHASPCSVNWEPSSIEN